MIEQAHRTIPAPVRNRLVSPLPGQLMRSQPPAAPCTSAELAALAGLLHSMRPRPVSVVVGTSRDAASMASAASIAETWDEAGGTVLATVNWPETAASWLRQARRFARPMPDAWIVTGTVASWVAMGRRLVHSTEWTPCRTIAMASLADPALVTAGGAGTFSGLRGVHGDGSAWEIVGSLLVSRLK